MDRLKFRKLLSDIDNASKFDFSDRFKFITVYINDSDIFKFYCVQENKEVIFLKFRSLDVPSGFIILDNNGNAVSYMEDESINLIYKVINSVISKNRLKIINNILYG